MLFRLLQVLDSAMLDARQIGKNMWIAAVDALGM